MNSADGENIRDVERKLLSGGYLPTTSRDSSDEKGAIEVAPKKRSKMLSLRHFLFTLLAISLLAVTLCSANGRVPRSPSARDQQKFQELLNGIESSSLHEVLHNHVVKYKHGVFKEDKAAVAAIHRETPEVATSLAALVKRQDGPSTNGTGVATSTTVATTEATATLTSSITSSSVVTQTSDSSPSSTPVSNESTPTSSAPPTVTETSTSTGPSETAGGTTDSSQPTASSTSEGSSPSSGSSESDTSSPSPTSQTSITSITSITSLNIYTTTLANGQPATITQTTIVPAGLPDQTGGGSTSKTNPSASLQTNGASMKETGTNFIFGIIAMLFLGVL